MASNCDVRATMMNANQVSNISQLWLWRVHRWDEWHSAHERRVGAVPYLAQVVRAGFFVISPEVPLFPPRMLAVRPIPCGVPFLGAMS